MDTIMMNVEFNRGLEADLPEKGVEGNLYITTDTHKMYDADEKGKLHQINETWEPYKFGHGMLSSKEVDGEIQLDEGEGLYGIVEYHRTKQKSGFLNIVCRFTNENQITQPQGTNGNFRFISIKAIETLLDIKIKPRDSDPGYYNCGTWTVQKNSADTREVPGTGKLPCCSYNYASYKDPQIQLARYFLRQGDTETIGNVDTNFTVGSGALPRHVLGIHTYTLMHIPVEEE